jgi:Insect pheromone-binding family, A10/OS-D
MSCVIVVSLSLLLLALPSLTSAQGSFSSLSSTGDDEKNYYSRRYDSIDVDTIFRSQRLLNNYVDCLLDKKPCPPEGKDLKRKKSSHTFCSCQIGQ